MTEAQRVAALRKMKVAEVVDRAAKGAFTYEKIKQLTPNHIPAMKVATDVLRKVTLKSVPSRTEGFRPEEQP
jgi:hypothetical protein